MHNTIRHAANTNAQPLAGRAANILSMNDYRHRTRVHRTVNGVFFSTDVLLTKGEVA
ncbi:hypothetical protein PSA7680_00249 [Pseudoruegeria aquimaris]|uniref:Uncharacterized protein n=1 Tax=Pseudoruegeria aquimaris TaxID=393663 RepID=A0A1Y5RF61_9RHOB|nr:hypothetical protein [Pseudoruegeria aquimaris]SLN13213.1 hypothetical protein PSA7680_00249 [Pseudoruegeria aquimaris]